jgi:hypothetical protein
MADNQRIELLQKLNGSSLPTISLSGFKACVEHLLTTDRDYALSNEDLQNAITAYRNNDYDLYTLIPMGMLDDTAWSIVLKGKPATATTIDVLA